MEQNNLKFVGASAKFGHGRFQASEEKATAKEGPVVAEGAETKKRKKGKDA